MKAAKVKKFLFSAGLILFTIVIIVAIYILSHSFYMSDEDLHYHLRTDSTSIEIGIETVNNYSMRYSLYPNSTRQVPTLVMLHGAPGSCADFNRYMTNQQLQSHMNLLSIDRPGYGKSSGHKEEFLIEEQATLVTKLVNQVIGDSSDVILLSHSYGGPIAALMADEIGQRCLGHVMVAPVIDPYSEEVFWYSGIPLYWPFSIFASASFKRASLEKLGHKEELATLKGTWSSIRTPTIHIHGDDDWLASIQNVPFCESTFDQCVYESKIIKEGSHFILWSDSVVAMIIEEVIQLASLLPD